MIGKIMTGGSFRGCLLYCLQDKIANEKKNEVVMQDRAEVILYNQCFGNDKELIQQFNEVSALNPGLSKPVLHITLSLSLGENLPAYKLAEMAQECSQDLGFCNNQFVTILHKDTEHPHIHIVANRIGYDGKTLSDSHNYQKIAKLCRKLELKHNLKQVQSPNAFLPKELRNYQRLDGRKQQLKTDISRSLATSKNYDEFEQKMKALKYDVIRMRGIAFRDQQKVYTKGSEVGYSLGTIEKILAQKQALTPEQKTELRQSNNNHQKLAGEPEKMTPMQPLHEKQTSVAGSMKDVLLEEPNTGINPALVEEERKRHRRLRQRN